MSDENSDPTSSLVFVSDVDKHPYVHGDRLRLSPEEASKLDQHRGARQFDAYYYGFEPTGNLHIDRILIALCAAGKGYHNTESWSDDEGRIFSGGESYIDVIQAAANSAAQALK